MKEPEVDEAIRTGKLNLGLRGLVWHFRHLGSITLGAAFAFFMWASEHLSGNSYVNSWALYWAFLFILMILSLPVAFFIRSRGLKFTKITTPLSRERSIAIIDCVAANHSWKFIVSKKRIRVARTNSALGSDGSAEQITIIWNKEYILVNSIRDSKRGWSFRSIGRNKDNIDTIFRAIRNADQNRGIAAVS